MACIGSLFLIQSPRFYFLVNLFTFVYIKQKTAKLHGYLLAGFPIKIEPGGSHMYDIGLNTFHEMHSHKNNRVSLRSY